MHALRHTDSKHLQFIDENTKYNRKKFVLTHTCVCSVCINAFTDIHENLRLVQYMSHEIMSRIS